MNFKPSETVEMMSQIVSKTFSRLGVAEKLEIQNKISDGVD